MTAATIQRLIDDLAARLRRSVVIDDIGVRLLYTSPHYGDEDEVRVQAVLQRHASSQAVGHVLAQGVTGWTTAGVIPAKPEIGFRTRVCVPIRWRGEALGLLIVLDAEGTLTTSELATLTTTAADLAPMLAEVHGPPEATADRAREPLVADLLDTDPELRRAAVLAIARPAGDRIRAVALEVRDVADTAAPSHIAIAVRRALASGPAGSRLFHVGDRRAALLRCTTVPVSDAEARREVDQVLHRVDEVSDGRFTCVAGIGATVTGLAAAWSSYRQARLACRAAAGVLPAAVVHWSELGALGVLLRLPEGELGPEALPDEVRRLLAVDPDGRLAVTVRAYLDAAGSGPGASAALHIHRTTLYYRLERVTELTGLDLTDGRTRLALHVGLHLHDLILRQSEERRP